MDATELRGAGVLVTRPAHQAAELCRLISEAGGRPIPFPVLAIEGPRDPAAAESLVAQIGQYDLAIFISPNAVEYGLGLIERLHGELPPTLQLATVGKGSARALRRRLGRGPDVVPAERFDSEALLALPAMHSMAGRRIIIFRGEGGRALLGETLRARGAGVDYAEVYRRALPKADSAALLARWAEVDIVTVSSTDGLYNLHTLLGEAGRERLLATPLVVVSERAAEAARALGFSAALLVSPDASDTAVLGTVAAWAANHFQAPENEA